MLSIDELRQLNKNDLDIDERASIINRADVYDTYLIKLMQRFKEKIDFENYFLSYSGGKDSHLLYWFIKEILQDQKIKIVGINTFLEHHEIRDRILKNSDIVLYPKLKPMEIKEKYGSPCFSKMQDEMIYRWQNGNRQPSIVQFVMGTKNGGKTMFKLSKKARTLLLDNKLHKISNLCCKYLKKEPMKQFKKESGLNQILGVRSFESLMRKAQYQTCFNKDGTFTPIFDLTDEIENEIYNRYNIEIPKVYDYVSRTGCMGCPYGSYKGDTRKELDLISDSQRKFICEYFKESYKVLGIDTRFQTTIYDYIGDKK